jgi:hypothetical protein
MPAFGSQSNCALTLPAKASKSAKEIIEIEIFLNIEY